MANSNKRMKRCAAASLTIRELQIRTTMCHHTPIRMATIEKTDKQVTAAAKDVEKLELLFSCAAGGTIKCVTTGRLPGSVSRACDS